MEKKYNLGINGFGHIGRLVCRIAFLKEKANVMAINAINDGGSIMTIDQMVLAFKYDNTYGTWKAVTKDGTDIVINGTKIKVFYENQPVGLKWGEFKADYVCDTTGKKTQAECIMHIKAGAKKVLMGTTPIDDTPMIINCCNQEVYNSKMLIVSNTSPTTNSLAPLAKLLNEKFGIVEGLMTTINAMALMAPKSLPKEEKDLRAYRSGDGSIIPIHTLAAKTVEKILPVLNTKLNGMAFTVPSKIVSVIDFTVQFEKPALYEDISKVIKEASEGAYKDIIGYTESEDVQNDFIGNINSAIFDKSAGLSLNDNFAKIICWFDNDWSFSNRMIELMYYMATKDGNLH